MSPLEDFKRAGPATSIVLMGPFEVVIRSSTASRGTLMTNRAPQFPRSIEGRTTRMATIAGLLSIAILSESASAWEREYLVPLISTVSWSHPEISTDPLNVGYQ